MNIALQKTQLFIYKNVVANTHKMEKNRFLLKFENKTKQELQNIIDSKEKYTLEAINAAKSLLTNDSKIEIKYENNVEEKIALKNETKNIKLHSKKAVAIASFFGGPLAVSYLIRENYLQLEKPDEAKNSILIGIIVTFLLFTGLFFIPENTLDMMPSQIIPLISLGISFLVLEKYQGDILKNHEENNNLFFTKWRAAFIGFISSLIIVAFVFFQISFSSENIAYDEKIDLFIKNESETISIYNRFNTESSSSILDELNEKTIPTWKKNIDILKSALIIDGVTPEMKKELDLLMKYSELRLEAFELIKNSIVLNTEIYAKRLDKLHLEIEKQLELINKY